jgi:hypothetical protein
LAVLSRLCYGKGRKTCSHFKSPRRAKRCVAGNMLPASYGLSGAVLQCRPQVAQCDYTTVAVTFLFNVPRGTTYLLHSFGVKYNVSACLAVKPDRHLVLRVNLHVTLVLKVKCQVILVLRVNLHVTLVLKVKCQVILVLRVNFHVTLVLKVKCQ